jgi:hypothetical protein
MDFRFTLAITASMCVAGFSKVASAQSPSEAARPSAQTFDGNYQGTLVCEQVPYAAGPLRAPLDITISGGSVKFARPVFNLDGTRVFGSEIGGGSVDGDGKVHLTSSWVIRGGTAQGSYDGVLTVKGGTLTGNQSWVLGGEPRGRQCFAAVVRARVEPSHERVSE